MRGFGCVFSFGLVHFRLCSGRLVASGIIRSTASPTLTTQLLIYEHSRYPRNEKELLAHGNHGAGFSGGHVRCLAVPYGNRRTFRRGWPAYCW